MFNGRNLPSATSKGVTLSQPCEGPRLVSAPSELVEHLVVGTLREYADMLREATDITDVRVAGEVLYELLGAVGACVLG